MALAEHSEFLVDLPSVVREELFSNGRSFDNRFLEPIANNRTFIFQEPEGSLDDLDPDEAAQVQVMLDHEYRQTTRDLLRKQDFIFQYAGDFFGKNEKGEPQIPTVVFKIMALDLHLMPADYWNDNFSDDVKSVLVDIFKLQSDPYPKETSYASQEARFIFLGGLFQQLETSLSYFLMHGLDEDEKQSLWNRVVEPAKTLDSDASALEDLIVGQAERLDFAMAFEDDPYHAPIAMLRHALATDPNATSTDLLQQIGFPVSDNIEMALLFAIAVHTNEKYGSHAEALYEAFQHRIQPLQFLMDFHEDLPEDIIIYGILSDYFEDENRLGSLKLHLSEDIVERCLAFRSFLDSFEKERPKTEEFEAIRRFFKQAAGEIVEGKPKQQNQFNGELDPKTQAQLLDLMSAVDYCNLNRIDLVLDQDPYEIPNANHSLVHSKARLLPIKERHLRPRLPEQSPDLREFVREQMRDVWQKFDYRSRMSPMGRLPMTFADDEGPNTPPSA